MIREGAITYDRDAYKQKRQNLFPHALVVVKEDVVADGHAPMRMPIIVLAG